MPITLKDDKRQRAPSSNRIVSPLVVNCDRRSTTFIWTFVDFAVAAATKALQVYRRVFKGLPHRQEPSVVHELSPPLAIVVMVEVYLRLNSSKVWVVLRESVAVALMSLAYSLTAQQQ